MFANALKKRRAPTTRRLRLETLESRHLLTGTGIAGDANNDGLVNGLDIVVVAEHWLTKGSQPLLGDVNSDGIVNGLDINVIANNWLRNAVPPSVTVPAGPLKTDQNAALPISGVSVADKSLLSNTSTVQLKLAVTHGTLSLATSVSGGITSAQVSQNSTSTVTITATLSAINATLAAANGLLYTPTNTYAGADTLTATISDLGHTTWGIPLSTSQSTQIIVTGASVTPTSVPGLQFWLDPYDTSTMTLTNVAETTGSPTSNLQSASGTPFDLQGNGMSSQFTMAFWVYPETTWASNSWLMADAKNTFGNNDISWFLSVSDGATGSLRTTYSLSSSTSTIKDYANAMPLANQWYFVVITYDGSQVGTATTQDQLRQQVYVNGQQIPTPAGNSLPQKIYAAANAGKLYLGAVDAAINNTTAERFQDVGFWNHWISSSTAAALWNGGAGVTYATLPVGANDPFAYYAMNEASGTRFDSTSNHYDLTAGAAGVGSVQEISAWRDKSSNHVTMLFGYDPDTGIQQRQYFGVYSLTARDGLPGVVMPAGAWAYAASSTIASLASGNLFMNVQLDAPNNGENELFDFSDDVTNGQDSFMGINYIGPNTAPDAGPPAGSGNPNTSTYVPTFHTHAGNAVTHAGGWTANILNIDWCPKEPESK